MYISKENVDELIQIYRTHKARFDEYNVSLPDDDDEYIAYQEGALDAFSTMFDVLDIDPEPTKEFKF